MAGCMKGKKGEKKQKTQKRDTEVQEKWTIKKINNGVVHG